MKLGGCPRIAKNNGIQYKGEYKILTEPLPSPVSLLLQRVPGDRRGEPRVRPENGNIAFSDSPLENLSQEEEVDPGFLLLVS